ncbi:AP-5 complex subunit zeta-1 C-terminal TPR domain-containing protein [Entamoeba marina]
MSKQQPLTIEDKLLEYRKLLPFMFNYGTGATPIIIKSIIAELANEKSPLLLKYIASQMLFALPEMNISLSGDETDIYFILHNIRKGIPVSKWVTPSKIIALIGSENKMLTHQLIPVLFSICSREFVTDAELSQVETTITRYLQMAVVGGTLDYNPTKLPLQIQEVDGKPSNTSVFTIMNISNKNLFTNHMSQHHQIVSDLIQYVSLVKVSTTLYETIINYTSLVLQQLLRVQTITPLYAAIYHEMIRLLGIISTKQPSLTHNVTSTLSTIRTSAERVDPFVALSLLDSTLTMSSEFVQNNTQKMNAFISEYLINHNGYTDQILVTFAKEPIFFPFSAIALHSTSIQRDILPLISLFITNNTSTILHYILDLPILALLHSVAPPQAPDYDRRAEPYQFAFKYMHSKTYSISGLWKKENRNKLDELFHRPEKNSGRVKAAISCVPSLLRVFFQAASIHASGESETLSMVKEIISRYDNLYPDQQYIKNVREAFITALGVMVKAVPTVIGSLVAALDGLLKRTDFADNSHEIEFANQLCLIVGEHAHSIPISEVEFLLAQVDPQIFEDSNYPEYLQVSLLGLYCKLGQAIGQNTKVKLTLCKLIDKVSMYPLLSMRVKELYALFATPGLAEASFKYLQMEYIDVDAPLPALVSTLDSSDAQPLHPFTLYVDGVNEESEK